MIALEGHKQLLLTSNNKGLPDSNTLDELLSGISMSSSPESKQVQTEINSNYLQALHNEESVLANLAALEKRIFGLEKLIGSSANSIDVENGSGIYPLTETIQRMEQRIALLDPTTVDKLREKIILVKNEVESLKRDKTKLEENQRIVQSVKTVEDLYAQMQRYTSI